MYRRLLALAPLLAARLLLAQPQAAYVPGAHDDWQRRGPDDVGLNPDAVRDAIAFIQTKETKRPRDLRLAHDLSFGREPYGEPLGPYKSRGDLTGVILKGGYLVAEWGEPHRVDMTFSATKSYLSVTVGLAADAGLIQSIHDPVNRYVTTGEFDSTPMNRKITWDHLLRQTSDWQGTLWGKPDWADRPPAGADALETYRNRQHAEPGSTYKYNDTRVNLLAYSALQVWRKPLPQVLKERIMDPIGASQTWRWHGYENSWVNIDGVMMQSVAGGAHFGGGLWISARDHARFGLLTLRQGKWGGRQLLSENWVKLARTPTPVQPTYGFMNWYLNTGRKLWPSAPATAFAHIGNGTNMVYCDSAVSSRNTSASSPALSYDFTFT